MCDEVGKMCVQITIVCGGGENSVISRKYEMKTLCDEIYYNE